MPPSVKLAKFDSWGETMYRKHALSLREVRRAMNAMLNKATEEADRPVAIAIVDDSGNLLNYARMDGCRTNPQTFAIRKAYTAAMSGRDSGDYAENLKSQGRSVTDMGNPNLVAAQGAVVILHPETKAVLGAIGVSGLSSQEDEDLSRLGVEALRL
ncbi:MAG: heme-binding protein [Dehalococcoidia bacterium]